MNNETYLNINDVPPQLQSNIKFAHETGVPVEALAIIYDMPTDWITVFTAEDQRLN